MNRTLSMWIAIFFLYVSGFSSAIENPVDYVRPQIDTVNSRWFYFSSACRPFGMVNLSPDTDVTGSWGSGYLYDEHNIRCFSHIHGWQISGIPVMPGVGAVQAHLGFDANKAPFSHDNEIVKPGYHKVILSDRNIQAELTSTSRVGFHRYQFPASSSSHIAFSLNADLAHGSMSESHMSQIGSQRFEGYVTMAPTDRRKKAFKVYFAVDLDKPVRNFMAWENGEIVQPSAVQTSKPGYYLEFATTQDEVVLMKVALSYVSEQAARNNMSAELNHWNFDQIVQDSTNEWNQWLGKIDIQGGTQNQKIKFYTDLWHALLGRRIISDVDGYYPDNTGDSTVVRRVRVDAGDKPLFPHYNSDAFWGTQWSLQILWSLVYPEVMDGFCNMMIDVYRNGGLIPRGPSGGNYTYVMIGDQAAPFIACAHAKGIRNWDVNTAYEGLRKNAFLGGIRDRAGYEATVNPAGGGMKYYLDRDYIPLHSDGSGGHREGAAQTLEYAYQDWCLAQMAKAMGFTDDENLFMKRSANYRNIFDPHAGSVLDPSLGFDASSGWMRPRSRDGAWYADFYPVVSGTFNAPGFVESNSAIYTWFVPQDIPGLAALMGGPEKAIRKLHRQFELSAANKYVSPHGGHGSNWLDYENQPGTHVAHLFNHLGAPWLSQYWVRRVKEEAFGDITPYGGYNGDEDQGQMGALGVLMAIGLFDIQGGAACVPAYEITTPLFDQVTIHLNQDYYAGQMFRIVCHNQGADNVFIQDAVLNGQALASFKIPHQTVAAGGTVELNLGQFPSKWAQTVSVDVQLPTQNRVVRNIIVNASSSYNEKLSASRIVDGAGLTENIPIEASTHTNTAGGDSAYHWHTADINGDFSKAWIEFDFGDTYFLDSMVIWNLNSWPDGRTSETDRGIKDFNLTLSGNSVFGDDDDIILTGMTLRQATGLNTCTGQVVDISGRPKTRAVRLDALSSHGNNNLVGLSEVRFTYAIPECVNRPTADIAGFDCVVNLDDLAALAQSWLICSLGLTSACL